MEVEEEDALNNSSLAPVEEPEIAEATADAQLDLGMNATRFQLEEDASAVERPESQLFPAAQDRTDDGGVAGAVGEGLVAGDEKEVVDGEGESAPSVGTELVIDSVLKEDKAAEEDNVAEEEDQPLARVESPPGGPGRVEISNVENEVVVRESDELLVDKHDDVANYSGSDAGLAVDTKDEAAEVVEEAGVAAVTCDAVDGQVLKDESDDQETAAQDVVDAGNEDSEVAHIPEKTTVFREPMNDDDVGEQGDATGATEIHEETDMGNTEAAGVREEAAEIEGAEDSDAGEEIEVADAAVANDMEVGDIPEDIGEDGTEEDASLEVEMDNVEDDPEGVEEADSLEVLQEETDATEDTDLMEEMEKEVEQNQTSAGQKRKRGRTPKGETKGTPKKKMEEDVCFICYDGGDLVLCDRRGCPKAYHPSCVNRDEAFFRTKGRWNCGWHLCSSCGKNANYMCYTCTFSLCRSCTRDSVIYCLKGKKGFCEPCMRTIKLIEDNLKGMNKYQVDFDDKGSWEYLFKDYYIDLKEKLGLTFEEISQAKSLWKGSDSLVGKQESPDVDYNVNDDEKSDSENSGDAEATAPKRRQAKRRSKSRSKERDSSIKSSAVGTGKASIDDDAEWASKELLEFVNHMTNGERKVVSQYDVQDLLLDYIHRNNLRDPKRRSQIICDARLANLFGKPRVGHLEMLKLLESHYLIKQDADNEGAGVDTDANQLEVDRNSDVSMKANKDKKRKGRRKGDGRGPQFNLDDYAAIDTHNVNLIYVRRNLLEDLLEDSETFHDKVVGSFVRIRISGSNQKQDLYRLVPVVGTSKTGEPYKVGKRMTDYQLEILNLNKTEVISIDTLSNQEFTEEECKRLRQSIKCGLIDRLTVGDIHEKAMALQAVRVKDWLEAETVRLSHLRDRASDLGRRKELRECVEKLQLLKTPEERQRRMEEIPEIHADPKMDPSYESEDDEVEEDDKRQDTYFGSRGSGGFSGRGREPISPQKGGHFPFDSSSGSRSQTRELSRNMSGRGYDAGENESSWSHVRDHQQLSGGRERRNNTPSLTPETGPLRGSSSSSAGIMSGTVGRAVSETQATVKVNEAEKIWHYQDPAGKIQGPFSMAQLRKWNSTGYFPADLRIWRSGEKQEESFLLNDALNGKFQKDPSLASRSQVSSSALGGRGSVEVPKYTAAATTTTTTTTGGGGEWRSNSTNLPSPTPGGQKTNLLSTVNGGIHAAAAAAQSSSFTNSPQVYHSQAPNNAGGGEVKLSTLDLQSLVQAMRNQSASVDTSHHKAEPIPMPSVQQPQAQGQLWSSSGAAAASSVANYASYGGGTTGYANPWRPPGGSGDQPSAAQSLAPSVVAMNNNWGGGGYVNPNNFAAAPAEPTHNTAAWVQHMPAGGNPSAGGGGWSGAPQVVQQVQASQVNPQVSGWGPPRNVNPGFVAAPGPQSSINPNPSWNQGNPNPNPNQNQNGDGYQRSYGGGGGGGGGASNNKPWNSRQQGGGGGVGGGGGGGHSRVPHGGCRFFFETGHCKKGASCNYRHS